MLEITRILGQAVDEMVLPLDKKGPQAYTNQSSLQLEGELSSMNQCICWDITPGEEDSTALQVSESDTEVDIRRKLAEETI